MADKPERPVDQYWQPGEGYLGAVHQGLADVFPGLGHLLAGDWRSALFGMGDSRIATMADPARLAAAQQLLRALRARVSQLQQPPSAPTVAELSRPWVGIYEGAPEAGRTVPRSYKAPKTYDLTDYFNPGQR